MYPMIPRPPAAADATSPLLAAADGYNITDVLAAQVYRGTARILRRDGWRQGISHDDPDTRTGRHCLLGAADLACEALGHDDALFHLIVMDRFRYDAALLGHWDALPEWNDAPDRTATEVITALDVAADQLDPPPLDPFDDDAHRWAERGTWDIPRGDHRPGWRERLDLALLTLSMIIDGCRLSLYRHARPCNTAHRDCVCRLGGIG